jgi:hypothetical protein
MYIRVDGSITIYYIFSIVLESVEPFVLVLTTTGLPNIIHQPSPPPPPNQRTPPLPPNQTPALQETKHYLFIQTKLDALPKPNSTPLS